MNQVNCKISRVYKKSDNILFVDIEKEKLFTLEDLEEAKNASEQLLQGQKFYSIINFGAHTIPDKSVREVSCIGNESELKQATAYVIHNLSQKIVADFIMRVAKPKVPTKFFFSITEAENWIKSLRKRTFLPAK